MGVFYGWSRNPVKSKVGHALFESEFVTVMRGVLRAGEKPSDLVVVAGEDGDTLVAFAGDDDTQVAVNPGFMVGLPELLVEKPWGVLLRCGDVATAGVVRLERLEDAPDGALLL